MELMTPLQQSLVKRRIIDLEKDMEVMRERMKEHDTYAEHYAKQTKGIIIRLTRVLKTPNPNKKAELFNQAIELYGNARDIISNNEAQNGMVDAQFEAYQKLVDIRDNPELLKKDLDKADKLFN